MDFFQCLGVLTLSVCCRLTTRDRGSRCSGAGQGWQGGDSDEKLEKEAELPGDTVDTSSESKLKTIIKKCFIIIISFYNSYFIKKQITPNKVIACKLVVADSCITHSCNDLHNT